jgi:dTDP-4-amino-4,6-dideoxygalactose transaminase
MSTAAAEAAVGSRTAGIVPVHLYGQMCDMESLSRLAEKQGLALIEDAAQAHGARYKGRCAGGFGAGAAFSFYPSKNLGALGDAGAVCTDDAAVAERLRRLRNLGQRRKGEHVEVGVNERLDALQAAFLHAKLRDLEAGNAARRAHAARYRRLLESHVGLLGEDPSSVCVYHVFPVRLPRREAVAAELRRAGIEVAVHYTPALHDQPSLRGRVIASGGLLNAAAWAADELSLPMGPLLREAEIERTAAVVVATLAAIGGVTELASNGGLGEGGKRHESATVV